MTHTGNIPHPEKSSCDYFKDECKSNWQNANEELLIHFRNLGYNSLGYDNNASTRKYLPHFGSCSPTGKVSLWQGKNISFPDVFSDAWKLKAKAAIERMAKNYLETPNLIGVYWTDMPAWDLKRAKQQSGENWVDAIKRLPSESDGKRHYEKFFKKTRRECNRRKVFS